MEEKNGNCVAQQEWIGADSDSLNEAQLRGRVLCCVEHLIDKRVSQLCKEHCQQHRYEYYCTVDAKWGVSNNEAALCEWGNATYAWTMEDLLKYNRIKAFAGQSNESVIKYFSKIIHSHVFKERFKDWRFGRRIRVPEYIKGIDKDAQRIYWRLRDNDEPENIAQQLGRTSGEVALVVAQINKELHKRNKLHLLHGHTTISIDTGCNDETSSEDSTDLMSLGLDRFEIQQAKDDVFNAYRQLTWKEQYLIDAMIVDGLKAASVLQALRAMGISLSDNDSVEAMSEQKIYYFLRKTVLKLKKLAGI